MTRLGHESFAPWFSLGGGGFFFCPLPQEYNRSGQAAFHAFAACIPIKIRIGRHKVRVPSDYGNMGQIGLE